MVFYPENYRRVCLNSLVAVHREILMKNFFFGKNFNFQSFSDFERYFFGIVSKNTQRIYENCILLENKIFFLEIFLFWQNHHFFIFFGHWGTNLSPFSNFFCGVVKSAFYKPRGAFSRTTSSSKKKWFLVVFVPWAKIFCLCQKINGLIVKTAF